MHPDFRIQMLRNEGCFDCWAYKSKRLRKAHEAAYDFNVKTGKLHLTDCDNVDSISYKNKIYITADREEIIYIITEAPIEGLY